MPEPLIPTPEQEAAIATLLASPTRSALNLSELGTGKTVISVETAKRLDAKVIFLIAPLGTRLGWKHTFAQQGVDLPFRWINSTKGGKESYDLLLFNEPGIYMIGVELFTRWSWNGRIRSKTFAGINPDVVIFDEAHRAQSRTSKTFKALMAVDGGYRMALSATMAGNRWEGAWTTARWAFPATVPQSYWNWVERYCATESDYFAPMGKKIVGEKIPGEFYGSLPCVVKLTAEQKPVVYEDRFVEMSAAQRKVYDKFERDLVAFLDGNPMIASVPIAQRIRLRQIALGVPKVDTEGNVDFDLDCKSSKVDETFEVLEGDFGGEPTLIGLHSSKFAKVLAHRLRERHGDVIGLWIGETSQVDREQIKRDFAEGRLKHVVATIPSLAEGVDGFQHATRNVLMVSRDENRSKVEQFVGRVNRTGQTRQVRVIELKAEGTHDDGVYSRQVQQALQMRQSLSLDNHA